VLGVHSGELHAEQLERLLGIVADASRDRLPIGEARALLAD
jgi:hypothetical protein